MSEFKVEVVRVGPITKHPNADSLSCTEVNGLPVIIKTGSLTEGDKAVYVPEDSVVPCIEPAFAFLAKHSEETARVRPIRLRGVYSEGLLIPARDLLGSATEATPVGHDVAALLGIVKYETPVTSGPRLVSRATQSEKDPGCAPRYDMEPYLKNKWLFKEGDPVVVTEKIHGCNFRAVYKDGRLFVGSHNTWRRAPRPPSKARAWLQAAGAFFTGKNWRHAYADGMRPMQADPWWLIARRLNLEESLRECPGVAIYGEIYGHVQDLKYSVPESDLVHFRAFDVFDSNRHQWMPYLAAREFCRERGVLFVPSVYRGPFNVEKVMAARGGVSALDGVTMREGVVICRDDGLSKPTRENLKLISEEYKLRKGDTTEFH